VVGARGYEFELFRGGRRVFATRTQQPALNLPGRWRVNGRQMTLAAGEYRWYVWPLRGGGRAAAATVQAKLIVPDG
jgi:hypothetical protein